MLPLDSIRRVYQVPVATLSAAEPSTVIWLPLTTCSSARLLLVSANRYILVLLVTREAMPTNRSDPLNDNGLTRACSW